MGSGQENVSILDRDESTQENYLWLANDANNNSCLFFLLIRDSFLFVFPVNNHEFIAIICGFTDAI